MRPSRGMGDINPSKMGKPKVKARRDNTDFTEYAEGGKVGLYANIHAKQKRIKAGSGEKMRPVGSKDAPSKADFIKSAKTARKK
jgi:hypothetical protein